MADYGIKPYPLMFDPSQWANKFSPFQGKPIPFPAQYQGTPTDALGRPIQSFLDAQAAHDAWSAPPQQAPPVTLNTSPKYGLQPGDLAGPSALNPSGNLAFGMGEWGGMMSPQARDAYRNAQYQNPGGGYTDPSLARTAASAGLGGGAPQAQAAAPTNPIDMNAAYLAALSNPGKVVTPGATAPQSPTPSNQSGVLQQFLANWQGQPTQGAGNYNNKPFFDALRGFV